MKYWKNEGKFQVLADNLRPLIPHEGTVNSNRPALEKLRVASNCYYDLYNNGLGNRRKEFYATFKLASADYTNRMRHHMPNETLDNKFETALDAAMDAIVLAAWQEHQTVQLAPYDAGQSLEEFAADAGKAYKTA